MTGDLVSDTNSAVGSAHTTWELVEAPFAQALVELGEKRPDVVVLSADLSKYTDIQDFATAFPERFIQCGMAEQNMLGVAGGLAKAGLLPIAVTYGVFATRRAYDQLAMSLLTGSSHGIVVAFLPGITTPFRATHQAIDDLALMRALPGIVVIDPADATELAGALKAAAAGERTVYLRGLRGRVAKLFDAHRDFEIGQAREIRHGNAVGLIGTGLGTQWALEAADLLGEEVAVLHAPTLKPFDREAVSTFCSRFERVTTIENHSVIGGLGAAVAEVIAADGLQTRLSTLGVPDVWAPAGSLDYVRTQLGLDPETIARSVA
jgi:transketolase